MTIETEIATSLSINLQCDYDEEKQKFIINIDVNDKTASVEIYPDYLDGLNLLGKGIFNVIDETLRNTVAAYLKQIVNEKEI
jgi:hypothetical protein